MTPVTWLLTFLISATPVFELRGGIPFALTQGASPGMAYITAIAGNLAVVPVLLWGMTWGERLFLRWRWSNRLLQWVFAHTRRQGRWVERLGFAGLLLIVAIPLPGTGAWTGCVVAHLLGMSRGRALLWIALGVLLAGGFVLAAGVGALRWAGIEAA